MAESSNTGPHLVIRSCQSIAELPDAARRLLDAAPWRTHRSDFWRLIEKSRLEQFRIRYAVATRADGRVAGVAAYCLTFADLDIFGSGFWRRAIAPLRAMAPGLLRVSLVECGTPVTLGPPPIVVDHGVPVGDFLDALVDHLQSVADASGSLAIVARDFEQDVPAPLDEFLARGFRPVDGLPNTWLDIPWSSPIEYRKGLKSYFRSKLARHVRRATADGIRHERTRDFSAFATELHAQWWEVHRGAREFQREVLTVDFFRALPELSPSDASAILLYRGNRLVGHALLLQDGSVTRWLYFGRQRAANDSLYIYAAQAVVDAAIAAKSRRLEMGLTSYPVKLDLGATPAPIRLLIRARWPWLTPFFAFLFRQFNPVKPRRSRSVFSAAASIPSPGGKNHFPPPAP